MKKRVSEKILMKGNEAIAEAAIRAGVKAYFGYPITPQSELLEYMSAQLNSRGGVFLQAESEVAAINMVYGAAGCGERVMTSTSSPGFSLMQEGISYIASAELPCLLVNVQRGGPGLGTIQPAQSDYFQAVKGGGHGDYNLIVLAPNSVQEMANFTYLGFDLADQYRTPVLILADGALGQMMEPVVFPDYDIVKNKVDHSSWATRGKKDGKQHVITTLHIEPEKMEIINNHLQEKYRDICDKEIRFEATKTDDAEILLIAYGLSSRIAHHALELARDEGLKVGLFRPITLYPFPYRQIRALTKKVDSILTVEMNAGQMVEDVRLAVGEKVPVHFYGRTGGVIPQPEEILEKIRAISIAPQMEKIF
ncbi:MAG: 3-methyl-2-oxobutanoate dehydrogenase subunit VorB [Candidatus Marinimicrobia bacterium]|nr:3-methyl-2-oxobutanoate dehydrogenase subunit VorB [Candidatus Neomarinimicrobiota bacterium]MBL7010263.1 3-methyl-2-oxobutanoate dehydrogenase subunit VorB [Candidatus Neomarinimicrobiota bacterium]MBL7030215.1 3-methyl-2-oxobutanoate dehydrogenase subunit VorB [Candidatus Neomarinimicrobiota bacterium]